MQDILIINTGGTFNKVYNKLNGNLDIDRNDSVLRLIEQKWQTKFNYISIIYKDSLEFTQKDRDELLKVIKSCKYSKIVVIHGTDTIDISADFIAKNIKEKTVVFTGAMVPFWIDCLEATANLSMALGFCKLAKNGIYISLNGVVDSYENVIKNRELGVFEIKNA